MDFKDKILYARAQLNLTQEQLAKALKVAYITINRWENGKINPSKKAMVQFDNFCHKNNIRFDEVDNDKKN